MIRSPYTPDSIYLRGTISFEGGGRVVIYCMVDGLLYKAASLTAWQTYRWATASPDRIPETLNPNPEVAKSQGVADPKP